MKHLFRIVTVENQTLGVKREIKEKYLHRSHVRGHQKWRLMLYVRVQQTQPMAWFAFYLVHVIRITFTF